MYQILHTLRSIPALIAWLVLCLGPPLAARELDGTGKQIGVVDAWEGMGGLPGADQSREFHFGRVLTLEVANLDGWLMEELVSQRISGSPKLSDEDLSEIQKALDVKDYHLDPKIHGFITLKVLGIIEKMYPMIDGVGLPKAVFLRSQMLDRKPGSLDTIYLVSYYIDRATSDTKDWKALLKTSSDCLHPGLTLAFQPAQDGPVRQLTSYINSPKQPVQTFSLIIYSKVYLYISGFFILLVIVVLLAFAPRSEILRDISQPLRPDGRYPWSLSRAQMAFWFILVVAGFLILWVVNGTMGVINETCLTLIGIGSGTALGAAVIATYQTDADSIKARATAQALYGGRKGKTWEDIKADIKTENRNLTAEEMLLLDHHPARSLLFDWLTEDNVISFHRFQMLTWTCVLGLVFVVHTLSDLEMPSFDAALLALSGISAGTYLGFKLPPKPPATPNTSGSPSSPSSPSSSSSSSSSGVSVKQ